MPEGDTVFRTAESLRRWIGGRELTAARSVRAGVDLTPLVGQRVESVEARAKHLLIRFSGGRTLHTHMRMTGSWHVYPTGERWRKPAHRARVVLECGSRTAVCFDAPVVELLDDPGVRAQPSLRRLGPDVLGPGPVRADELHRRAAARAGESPTVAELLLDQQVVSGIGNIYRCESLFLCRVDPHTPSAEIAPAVLELLVATASRLMGVNARSGAIARRFDSAPEQPWVYRRAGRPCRRCG
ncbi:MAG: Fpg/Nei family DNA glycosylase, partial [Acidimicrobiales bacterium]